MHLDCLPDQRKAEPGTARLPSEIGIEDAIRYSRGNAGSVVADLDPDAGYIFWSYRDVDGSLLTARLGRVAQDVAERSPERVVVTDQHRCARVQVHTDLHGRRHRGSSQLGQKFGKIHRCGRSFGKTAELGKLTGELFQPGRFGHEHINSLSMFLTPRMSQLRYGQSDRGKWIPHLVRHTSRCFPEGPQPFRLDLLRPGALE